MNLGPLGGIAVAAPLRAEEFLKLVRKSGLVDPERLCAYLAKLGVAGALADQEPAELAGLLVCGGILTNFQAEQFLLGKWRGFTFADYKVLERLGCGRMACVYLCEHKLLHRRVAVKVLPSASAEDPVLLQRFHHECEALARLDHPNVVQAYEVGQCEEVCYLAMEYVDGPSLQDITQKSGPMAVNRAAHYIRQAALGLQHAHEVGIVHRDVKPSDILVDRSGVVKLIDFGLVRFRPAGPAVPTGRHRGVVLGTPDYMAPEQALDPSSVDIRADVYSLGATFYFCLAGHPPFPDSTEAQKLLWLQTRQPEPIRQLRPTVPEGMAAVIERMLAKDAAQRPQTPQEVADALDPFTAEPIAPPPDEEMPRLSPAAQGGKPPAADAIRGS
jgi:serine/threonine protein kinase